MIKDLKKQNSRFKRKIKSLKKNFAQEKYDDEGDDNEEPEGDGGKCLGKESKKKSKKIHY